MTKNPELKIEAYARVARQVAAESCVLLRNEKEVLPIRDKSRLALFGTNVFHYYKSGLGSGGLVNTSYVISILEAIQEDSQVTIDEELLAVYDKWIEQNPFDEGSGWGTVPWSQKEMPVDEALVREAAERNDVAIVFIGRTAGEDQDNSATAGSYMLTEEELALIQKVTTHFEKSVVLLNVGNIIDMKWVETYQPSAVMYVWQGGQEGGHGAWDAIRGVVTPCGKLTDTIAQDISDYPSTAYFGDRVRNEYCEDIYVGYRYFETVAKDKVLYPFGYGLSYTSFSIDAKLVSHNDTSFVVEADVKNTGKVSGKEVVQVYVKAPQGKLGKPALVLAGFAKTKVLMSGEIQKLTVTCEKAYIASFDDTGVTGNPQCMLWEAGEYEIFVGNSVRDSKFCGKYQEELRVLEQLSDACAPVRDFMRFKIVDGMLEKELVKGKEETQVFEELPSCEQDTSHIYKLSDVYENKISLDEFVATLSNEQMVHMFRGEGMCSPKGTGGTAGVFGGLTPDLTELGIPVGCCADGPSGVRMDNGSLAFSLPNGTAIGCTFNAELAEELFSFLGLEILNDKIDSILGPGMNIHRNPLNGRNFEYISEDPLLTGYMTIAQLKGLKKYGIEGTIKHFCGNNQEYSRTLADPVISQRALREIYLRGFEMAVKVAGAKSVMTTYGPLNGLWTAGNPDLLTTILRKEWGFDGIVMSDWWAVANWRGEASDNTNHAPMLMAQNDIFMLCDDTLQADSEDNILACLQDGTITRGMLVRNTKNILRFLLQAPAMKYFQKEMEATPTEWGEVRKDKDEKEQSFEVELDSMEPYDMIVTMKNDLTELAQIPIAVYVNNLYRGMISLKGSNGQETSVRMSIGRLPGKDHFIKFVWKRNEVTFVRLDFEPSKE